MKAQVDGRLKQSLLDMYAEDYQQVEEPAHDGRNGIAILARLRVIQQRLGACEKLIAAISPDTLDAQDMVDAAATLAEEQVTIFPGFVTRSCGGTI